VNYRILHRTVYDYDEPVTVSHHAARVKPRSTTIQEGSDFSLQITPLPAVQTLREDYFGNRVCYFSIQEIHERLEVVATSRVSLHPKNPADLDLSPAWKDVGALFRDPVSPEVVEPYQFCFDSPLLRASRLLANYAGESFDPQTPLLAGVKGLTQRIYKDFRYDATATTVATPLAEVLEKRRGVCQDFAHLAIAGLRSLGLPARYVSGYLRTICPPGQERLLGADASHAWFSAFCPGLGWVDFDPTNNVLPSEDHVSVAYGRDFSDVSPLTGILVGGGNHSVTVGVEVEEEANP